VLLATDGHEVRTAFDGDAALAVAAEFRPQIALIDIGLPKKNGYEVAVELRRLLGSEHMLLVALTGWGQAGDKERARSAGFDEHLTKPVDFELVRSLVGAGTSARNDARA